MKEIPWKGPHGQEFLYTGEVDQDGAPCGSGVAIQFRKFKEFNLKFEMQMTCLNGKEHGICKSLTMDFLDFYISFLAVRTPNVNVAGWRLEVEIKNGEIFGKGTEYRFK